MAEQRNAYKGSPPRAWVRLRLVGKTGVATELGLLADTGNPFAVIVSMEHMRQFQEREGPNLPTNFGTLTGGWVRVTFPELGINQLLLCGASDAVVTSARTSSPDFAGLAGLPLLRLLEYGGNADWFWLRSGFGDAAP